MPIETEFEPFLTWLSEGFLYWLVVVVILSVVGVPIGWLVAALRYGPVVGLRKTAGVLAAGAADLPGISPRRVWALTWLAVKESIRRRVVVVFAVFILVLAFAGLFLDPGSPNPA